MYEEFVESFKGDEGPGKDGGVKAFVRGGVVAPGSRSTDASGACSAGVWVSVVAAEADRAEQAPVCSLLVNVDRTLCLQSWCLLSLLLLVPL